MPDDTEEVLHRLEAQDRMREAAFRQMLIDEGRSDILAEYDAKMRDVRLGIDSARGTWHALSPAQRRVLETLGEGRWLIQRSYQKTRYDAHGEPHALNSVAGIATVRNLASRELVAWDGGAFEPEARAVLTERGRFVLKHGKETRDAR